MADDQKPQDPISPADQSANTDANRLESSLPVEASAKEGISADSLPPSADSSQTPLTSEEPISADSPATSNSANQVTMPTPAEQSVIPEEKSSVSPPPQDNIDVSVGNQQAPQVQQEAQKILHLPQSKSTLTDYFKELVSQGIFRREGKGKATYYHL